jgi:hypothetical protein
LPAEGGMATSPLLAMLGEEVETSVMTLPAGEDAAAVPVQRAFLQSPFQLNLSFFEKSSSTAGFCPDIRYQIVRSWQAELCRAGAARGT